MSGRQDDGLDVLELGDDRPRFGWRPLSPRELVALAVVVALGLVAGGGATLWWQRRSADRVLAAEAHVVGYVLPTPHTALDEELCTTLSLRLINAGRRPITIEAVAVDLARLRMTPDCKAPQRIEPSPVAPMAGSTWTVPVRVDCTWMSGNQEIRATVRTEAGTTRTESIRVGAYFHELSSCDLPYVDWDATATQELHHGDRPALRVFGTFTVAIRYLELVSASRIGSGAFTVIGADLPKRIGPHPTQGHLDIAVDNCADAADISHTVFDLDLETKPSVEVAISLDFEDPAIVAELVRLIEDTCGSLG